MTCRASSSLGVLPSMQTSHAPFSVQKVMCGPRASAKQRWPLSFAWRDIKNAGNQYCLWQ
jgi:predicted amidohydrolase YtcJ